MNCQICGKPSGYFPLCIECNALKEQGDILKCPICGAWRKKHDKCPKCGNEPIKTIEYQDYSTKKKKEAENTNIAELKCIICGENSNGKHFCRNCYAKYKDRSLDIRITNCIETEILDEYGNQTYKTEDGRKVRSRAELVIGNWLFTNKIRAVYEQEIFYTDENNENKILHPDFYLPDYEMYIEYNELSNPSYIKSKEYTQKIYNQLGLNVIIMTDKDLQNVAAFLKPKLGLH